MTQQYREAAALLKAEFNHSAHHSEMTHHFLNAEDIVGRLTDLVYALADGMDSIRLARVARPNGKMYRASKPAAAVLHGDQVVVLRTHDVAIARSVASLTFKVPEENAPELQWLSSYPSLPPSRPRRFYVDPEHGVPAVVFEHA
ncbi:hypothetical protein [Frondihabitans sp. 762G35]|uniref:hypothetical protein n=1 Tax=Frondihabitans sp. 762G35 TaxID=1446794 RepID=UPI000F4E5B12|nr:hypothetical protein [Frondihabitans sp. 762G35]